MAVGEFARPVYDLIEEIGNCPEATEKVFHEMVRFMSGIQIERFVSDLRRHWDLPEDKNINKRSESREYQGATVYK